MDPTGPQKAKVAAKLLQFLNCVLKYDIALWLTLNYTCMLMDIRSDITTNFTGLGFIIVGSIRVVSNKTVTKYVFYDLKHSILLEN